MDTVKCYINGVEIARGILYNKDLQYIACENDDFDSPSSFFQTYLNKLSNDICRFEENQLEFVRKKLKYI